jgi:2-succinyl-5-enolpyruvyl-6-hydroxy-3-cyclohexene-1-carboxylate synthase
LACRAVAHAVGPVAGPVHLNLPFREPLVPTGAARLDAPGRPNGAPWVRTSAARREPEADDVARLAALVHAHPRGLVVAGYAAGVDATIVHRFARAAGWPTLADPLSQVRDGDQTISTYEALLRVPGFDRAYRPDVIVRVGAPLTSKVTNAWLDGIATVLVDPDDVWLDPQHAACERVRADPAALLTALTSSLGRDDESGPTDEAWLADWLDAERGAPSMPCSTTTSGARAGSRATSRPPFPRAAHSWWRRACRCARSSGAWRRARG